MRPTWRRSWRWLPSRCLMMASTGNVHHQSLVICHREETRGGCNNAFMSQWHYNVFSCVYTNVYIMWPPVFAQMCCFQVRDHLPGCLQQMSCCSFLQRDNCGWVLSSCGDGYFYCRPEDLFRCMISFCFGANNNEAFDVDNWSPETQTWFATAQPTRLHSCRWTVVKWMRMFMSSCILFCLSQGGVNRGVLKPLESKVVSFKYAIYPHLAL